VWLSGGGGGDKQLSLVLLTTSQAHLPAYPLSAFLIVGSVRLNVQTHAMGLPTSVALDHTAHTPQCCSMLCVTMLSAPPDNHNTSFLTQPAMLRRAVLCRAVSRCDWQP